MEPAPAGAEWKRLCYESRCAVHNLKYCDVCERACASFGSRLNAVQKHSHNTVITPAWPLFALAQRIRKDITCDQVKTRH
eukprot:605270-Amphidinium_carterae.1